MRKYLPAAILIVLAIVLIVIGIFLQQPDSVLHKAIRICMECVGLG
ncbi:MAG: hypothetical protein J5715_08250 [Clostridiales bacterium]|nr:hypothetical protein [Clostridiales bacterium]